jgi:hypothetical protein
MARAERPADLAPVTPLRLSLMTVVGALALAALIGASSPATAGRTSCATSAAGYSYAGHQATHRGHGVRATITPTRSPRVSAGHVAGWVGVGGPGQGPNGEDLWMQVGIAAVPGTAPFTYVEIKRGSRAPQLMIVEEGLATGRPHRLAVLEMGGRPGWWRAWVNGHAVTKPVKLPGSNGRFAPIATAESWNGGDGSCNSFAFRFERVSVSYGGGGSWRPFVSAHRFLDGGNDLRQLATAQSRHGVYARTVSSSSASATPLPYAFVARSAF